MKSYEATLKILDSIFKRDDVRGIWETELDGEIGWHLGYAFASWLSQWNHEGVDAQPKYVSRPLRIVVGRDMRQGSPTLAVQLMKGMVAAGAEVDNLGMCSTELVYFAAGERCDECQGGAMVTASHNPPEYAGVKFVKWGAEPLSAAELEQLKAETARSLARDLHRGYPSSRPPRLVTGFVEKLRRVAGLAADPEADHVPLRVVIEAGNGMGGAAFRPFAKALEELLPGTEFIFSNEQPDGRFPLCLPNPLSPGYLALLRRRVEHERAELGICFDGDADRAGFVDGRGQELDAGLVAIALFEMLMQRADSAERRYVLGNLNTGLRFRDFLERQRSRHGWTGEFVWTPVGHAKIKGLMRAPPHFVEGMSRVLFAAEHSGHYFYPDFYCAASGITTALFVIRRARELKTVGRSLGDRREGLREKYYASGELNERVASDQKALDKIHQVAAAYAPGNRARRGIVARPDGVQVVQSFTAAEPYDPDRLQALDLRVDSAPGENPRWWLSVRKSGNEPQLRLNVESDEDACMRAIRDKILGMMRS